jgi:hypothetical protein
MKKLKTFNEFLNESNGNGKGDCYVAAAKLVQSADDDFVLVHGMVDGQGALKGLRYGHAWVEYKGRKVLDHSNGNKIEMPKDVYYSIGNIKEEDNKYYKPMESIKWMLKTKNWGPWEMSGDTVTLQESIPDQMDEIGKKREPISRTDLKKISKEFDESYSINEVGEGTSKPFEYKMQKGGREIKMETNIEELFSYADAMFSIRSNRTRLNNNAPLFWKVSGDKGYYTIIMNPTFKRPISSKESDNEPKYHMQYDITFDAAGGEAESLTNFNEQYRLLATIIKIMIEFNNEASKYFKVDEILISPKLENYETDLGITPDNSKRGKFYLAYVKKNLKRLEGKWSARIDSDGHIILKVGT